MRNVGLYWREFDAWGKGAAEYVRETFFALARAPDPRLHFHVIVPEGPDLPEAPASFEFVRIPKTHRIIQDHWLAPRAINRLGLDAVWLPKNVMPYGLRCPAVVSFLDLAYFRPEYNAYSTADNLYMRAMMRRSAKKASRLVAISEHTKRDIVEILGVPEARVSVIYPVLSGAFQVIEPQACEAARRKYGLPEQFLFYAGNMTPRKNLVRVMAAFAKVRDAIPHDLVLTGTFEWNANELKQSMASISTRVHRLGKVPPEDLPAIYNLAAAYVHVSLYEGFGLTVLEAQACGVPVLNSTSSCMPEVGGDGACYVDPVDVDAIADGMVRLATDDALRRDLTAKGFENTKRFQGQDSARQLQELLARV